MKESDTWGSNSRQEKAEDLVGIPANVGQLELRDLWLEIQRATGGKDVVNVLRNDEGLAILEKLETVST